jgi:transposase
MVLADGKGIPLGVSVHPANPAEVKLAEETLNKAQANFHHSAQRRRKPARLIADRAYDSDPFRTRLAARGIEQITPHRSNRRKPGRQDGRALRRYRKRWKIERSIAWLGNFRRLVVRWDRSADIFTAFVHIACLIIVCRYL